MARAKTAMFAVSFLGFALACGSPHSPAPEAARRPESLSPIPPIVTEEPDFDLDRALAESLQVILTQSDLKPDDRIAVVPLTSAAGGTTRLGFFLAEKISHHLVTGKRCRVADRSQISRVMVEKDLACSDLVEAAEVMRTAKLMAIDYLVGGTLVDASGHVEAALKLLDGSTGELIVSAGLQIPKTDDVRSMLAYVQRPHSGGGDLPPLTLSYHLFCRRGDQDVRLTDGSTVRSGEAFKIWLLANSDCYAYVLLLDSQGTASVLFPHAKIRSGNFLHGGIEYVVPPPSQSADAQWYIFDENPGTERFFILASYEPVQEMDQLLREIRNAAGGHGTMLTGTTDRYARGMKGLGTVKLKGGFQVRARGVDVGRGPAETSASVSLAAEYIVDLVQGVTSVARPIVVQHEP